MLLGNSELQLRVVLYTLFLQDFSLSLLQTTGSTQIKQLLEGSEVNFSWWAALLGGCVVLEFASKALHLSQGRFYSEKVYNAL